MTSHTYGDWACRKPSSIEGRRPPSLWSVRRRREGSTGPYQSSGARSTRCVGVRRAMEGFWTQPGTLLHLDATSPRMSNDAAVANSLSKFIACMRETARIHPMTGLSSDSASQLIVNRVRLAQQGGQADTVGKSPRSDGESIKHHRKRPRAAAPVN